jgi:hypothetical protein
MKESIHSILKSDPFEDGLEVQAAYLTLQAIQGPFSVLPPVAKIRGGRELVKGSCCSKKLMTKGVLVKKPVQVVPNVRSFSLTQPSCVADPFEALG